MSRIAIQPGAVRLDVRNLDAGRPTARASANGTVHTVHDIVGNVIAELDAAGG